MLLRKWVVLVDEVVVSSLFEQFIGLAYQGKDIGIVFRFIIEYSSLRDFGPEGNNNNRSIFIWGFLTHDILACVETWD